MSEQKHTKEPWFVTEAYDGDVAIRTTPEPSTNICGDGVIFENSGRSSGSVTPEDAARICACVNALAGLNPEAVGQVIQTIESFLIRHGEYAIEKNLTKCTCADCVEFRAVLAEIRREGE